MSKDPLIEELCLRHCPYYKPTKDEETFCRGYIVVKGLIRQGKRLPVGKLSPSRSAGFEAEVGGRICKGCPYITDDCDYSAGVESAPPCGGLIVLAVFVELGIIGIDDIAGVD